MELKQEEVLSRMAAGLKGSEIIRLSGEINDRIRKGEHIFNLTIGDFDPSIYPIPDALKQCIIDAYNENETNYPPASGIAALRTQVAEFIIERQNLDYPVDDYLIACGARPLIYALYQTILDPGDKVLFPVPSWNNNHYTHLSHASQVMIETHAENDFMPVLSDIQPFIQEANLLALCSPLNPTGTVFKENALKEICDAVLVENQRRENTGEKPLYVLYDQIYWVLTYGNTKHADPINLLPALRPYVIYIDGLSKAFAATGVRIGWAFGPEKIIAKMRSILGHVGAWAPKAEQVALSRYLSKKETVTQDILEIKTKLQASLNGFYAGFAQMQQEGYPVSAIPPQAAMYLTVKIDLRGKTTPEGTLIKTMDDVTTYLLQKAGVAIVPFYAFGAPVTSPWFRLSVGTCKPEVVKDVLNSIRRAIGLLK
jgi:aspartate aminotransferase